MALADDTAARALALRLRELRAAGAAGGAVTQAVVARALGVSVPSISAWENVHRPVPPPRQRLAGYALYFAGTAASGGSRASAPEQLAPADRERFDTLHAELLDLHRAATSGSTGGGRPAGRPAGGPWHFPDGKPVTIVCAALPADLRAGMPYADPADPDYVEMHAYADLDALVELHGHVRAVNPHTQVNVRLAQPLDAPDRLPTAVERDDFTTHLVLLGGVDWNVLTRYVLGELSLPVIQSPRPRGYGGFVVHTRAGRRVFEPRVSDQGGRAELLEDVALYVRAVNPYNRKRTVTICNGQLGRGTYGVVRALTDERFRDRNAGYLEDRFTGTDTASVLTRVRLAGGQVLTPDWTAEDTVLHAWPEPGA